MKKKLEPAFEGGNNPTLTGQNLENMLKEFLAVFNVQPFSNKFPNSFHDNVATRTLLLTNNLQQGFEVVITPTQADYREPYDYPFGIKLYGVVGYSLIFSFYQFYHKPNFTLSHSSIEFEGEDEGFEKKCTDIIAIFAKYSIKFK